MTSPRLSVAVPLHNEESVLPELLRRLGAVLDAVPGGPHEIVMVDDGSTDRTAELLTKAAAEDGRVVAVLLSRNFGHQAALTAALDHVTGDATVVMDGDLQDRPEAIPQFLALHAQGYDVVYAKRVLRKEPWWLRLCYYTFYRLLARLSDIQLPTDAGDFGLMSRRVVAELRRMPEHHRYLRGLRSWVGFRQIGIDVERAERHAGHSKYSMSRLFGSPPMPFSPSPSSRSGSPPSWVSSRWSGLRSSRSIRSSPRCSWLGRLSASPRSSGSSRSCRARSWCSSV